MTDSAEQVLAEVFRVDDLLPDDARAVADAVIQMASAPFFNAVSIAMRVFSGASAVPPRWATIAGA